MRVQRFADSADRHHRTVGNVATREVRSNLLHDVIPKGVADALVQRAVADHGKLPRLGRNQYERGVFRIVPVQAGPRELVFRPFERVDGFVGDDAHGDLSGSAVLGRRDRVGDPRAFGARHGLKLTTGAFSAPGCDWK